MYSFFARPARSSGARQHDPETIVEAHYRSICVRIRMYGEKPSAYKFIFDAEFMYVRRIVLSSCNQDSFVEYVRYQRLKPIWVRILLKSMSMKCSRCPQTRFQKSLLFCILPDFFILQKVYNYSNPGASSFAVLQLCACTLFEWRLNRNLPRNLMYTRSSKRP